MKKMSLVLVLILLTFSGCATRPGVHYEYGNFIYFDGSVKNVTSEKAPATITVVAAKPSNAEDVGIVEAFLYGNEMTEKDAHLRLQQQAARMDADGVYNVSLKPFNQERESIHATAVAFKYAKKN